MIPQKPCHYPSKNQGFKFNQVMQMEHSKEVQNVRQCEDRISNLPSILIGHILSFLPTKDAVSTSILSTRWKQLWKLVTILDFDDYDSCDSTSLKTIFTSFVYQALGRCGVLCLHKFRLRLGCFHSCDLSHVNVWVASILTHGIEELDLFITILEVSPNGHVWPRDLFFCSTLVVLSLAFEYYMFNFDIPSSVCLPRLKTLHLDSVIFLDAGDSFKRLLLGCPVLDKLSVRNCLGENECVMHISAPVLTDLSLLNNEMLKFVIDTPALQYLELDENSAQVYLVLTNLCHLIKAEIGFGEQPEPETITDLFIGISNVQQQLVLLDDFVMAIEGQIPMFHNLTSLVLKVDVGWEFMSDLLEKSPRLEILEFRQPYLQFHDGFHWYPPQNVPSCLHSNLKVIEIHYFQPNKEELKMAKYFLKNAEVLEKLIMHSCNGAREEMEMLNELLTFPRRSSTCKVEACHCI